MTAERMSPRDALAEIIAVCAFHGVPEDKSVVDAFNTLRAYIADTQEIARLARELVEQAEPVLEEHYPGGGACWREFYALRDRLEKHDAK